MRTSTTADDGDPARQTRLPAASPAVLLLCILFACNNPATEKTQETTQYTDSIRRAAVQKTADSLKASQAVRKKKIYLTFDDGPNKGTRNVLQVIKDEEVPASFFTVAIHSLDTRQQAETWQLLKADTAIALCNHSYSHARNRYTSYYAHPDSVVADFRKAQAIMGYTNTVARMPGRNAWRIDTINHTDIVESKAAIDSLFNAGFSILGWDIEWTFDHKTLEPDPDTAMLLRRIYNLLDARKTKTPGHLVLLAHDQAFQKDEYVEQLRYVIQQLKNNPEYELLLATYYPGVR